MRANTLMVALLVGFVIYTTLKGNLRRYLEAVGLVGAN